MALTVARGQIWYARVPFQDEPEVDKRRPVLVIGWSHGPGQDNSVLCVPISSFGEGGHPRGGDIAIVDWAAAGLTKESWARAHRLWGADPASFDQARGPLGTADEGTVAAVLTEVAGLFM